MDLMGHVITTQGVRHVDMMQGMSSDIEASMGFTVGILRSEAVQVFPIDPNKYHSAYSLPLDLLWPLTEPRTSYCNSGHPRKHFDLDQSSCC